MPAPINDDLALKWEASSNEYLKLPLPGRGSRGGSINRSFIAAALLTETSEGEILDDIFILNVLPKCFIGSTKCRLTDPCCGYQKNNKRSSNRARTSWLYERLRLR